MRRPFRHIIIAISALLLCLQMASAGARQVMSSETGLAVICGENGVETVLLDGDFGPETPSTACCDCPLCLWVPALALNDPDPAFRSVAGHDSPDPLARLTRNAPPLWPVRPLTRAPPPTSRGLS